MPPSGIHLEELQPTSMRRRLRKRRRIDIEEQFLFPNFTITKDEHSFIKTCNLNMKHLWVAILHRIGFERDIPRNPAWIREMRHWETGYMLSEILKLGMQKDDLVLQKEIRRVIEVCDLYGPKGPVEGWSKGIKKLRWEDVETLMATEDEELLLKLKSVRGGTWDGLEGARYKDTSGELSNEFSRPEKLQASNEPTPIVSLLSEDTCDYSTYPDDSEHMWMMPSSDGHDSLFGRENSNSRKNRRGGEGK